MIQGTHYRTPCHSVSGQFFILPQQAGGCGFQPHELDHHRVIAVLFVFYLRDKVDKVQEKNPYSSYSLFE